ncbi:Leptomycin B resistance protein pmd1 [Venturia inaequalis]|nr:Leptomycin B resistance protein pmd1 [Venturia inaequalis]
MASPIPADATAAAGARSASALYLNTAITEQSEGVDTAVEVSHNHFDHIRRPSVTSFFASIGYQPYQILNGKGEIEVFYAPQHSNNSMLGNQESQSAIAISMALSPHGNELAGPPVVDGATAALPQHDHGLFEPAAVQTAVSQPPLMGAPSSTLPQHGNGHDGQAAVDQAAQDECDKKRKAEEKADKKQKRQEKLGKVGTAVKGVFGISFIVLNALRCAGIFDN